MGMEEGGPGAALFRVSQEPPGRPAWPVNPIADKVRSYARASLNRRCYTEVLS
ncbi:hypothetical protein SAMN05216577_13557 [Pseudomonas citronellolis]|uniref:Uncharacterized protein n=1 Tax=Pseudomonas citronellolis TaxID=53408 RepID=A0AAQ1KLJ2_9PSED|nr:hypothetical protein SAMN05216577_13557 [Pseudomonas citronellolis]